MIVGAHADAVGPDFAQGVAVSECPREGTTAGRVGDVPVLLSHFDGEWFAVDGACTHYGAALADGLIEARQVHCPLHHACFDLKTGAVRRSPALDPLGRWQVELAGDRLFIRARIEASPCTPRADESVGRVVIVGGGAAGLSCANELRILGFGGQIAILSADADPPCDRPNLSKDYLAGTAAEEWIPLRSDDWYREQAITLRLATKATSIDLDARAVVLESGERVDFDHLLLATGAEPRRLPEHGFDGERVFTLRSLADARAVIAAATSASRAAIIGSSFIGMEAAAALRSRGLEVDVISPEHVPFERVFGPELGELVQQLHRDKGVHFHLGTVATGFENGALLLATGEKIPADLVLVAVGVVPRIELAEAAGLDVGDGVPVDENLRTTAPGVFAAGDIAAFPDPLTGELIRIEHWAVAEQQGRVAAANMMGLNRRFAEVPFFWTEQYGVAIRYVGRASDWDEVTVDGNFGADGCMARYLSEGQHVASAAINRDREALEEELRLEQRITRSGMAQPQR
jgi:NADPH-dependent 2,4-dienoyl-CoA reductase/sulfur reductase-like enzyme/nitrite reductase/ring-hydroxylating ferredoxin subunit